ncbi:molybdate ABC transporter permease subunit [Lyngbya confervoides]|uniref:Molybdenum transport system permease n=1 Tax=Lyngbya confervoides BDU141951 TaxID=1574623 RepID=A0ABD4T1R1_9CYAN|nr:molybdate ABC transporter permease subunit [Lyngbya confervoides]MCM1982380.1 molybdate ABC transporter permease subunit [Lyngbya confervoides BDU141951]
MTFRLAILTTGLLLVLALPLSYWLAYSPSRLKPFFEAMISLPLVLPPTVLGFYLLIAFSPRGLFGQWLEHTLGLRLVFSFAGLVIASMIHSLPFMVQPLQAGFAGIPPAIHEAAAILGKSKLTTLWRVLIPNLRASLLTGMILTFAHTVGEFGVVLMIGGNIPGQTQVASIAIYEEVEALNYSAAHVYALILVTLSFSILVIVYGINGGYLRGIRQ